MMRQYVAPYKSYLFGGLVFNVLSAVLNVFSFISIIPMLQLLFGIDKQQYEFIPWDAAGMGMKDILINNLLNGESASMLAQDAQLGRL